MPAVPTDAPLPILATAVVPWTADYSFDAGTFRRQVRTIARGLTRHIYVFGTAGEGYGVSDAQFREIATCFWETAQEEKVTAMLGIIFALAADDRRTHRVGTLAGLSGVPALTAVVGRAQRSRTRALFR
jgi:hypothetical protein